MLLSLRGVPSELGRNGVDHIRLRGFCKRSSLAHLPRPAWVLFHVVSVGVTPLEKSAPGRRFRSDLVAFYVQRHCGHVVVK